jgi:hypothetical protein
VTCPVGACSCSKGCPIKCTVWSRCPSCP